MALASVCVILLRIAGFALSTLMVRSTSAVYLSYALPVLASALCLLLIFAGPKLNPLISVLTRGAERMMTAARLRFARPA